MIRGRRILRSAMDGTPTSFDLLYNPRLKRRYRVEDDVPQMLIDEATTATEREHDALMAKAEAEGVRPNF